MYIKLYNQIKIVSLVSETFSHSMLILLNVIEELKRDL